MRVLRFDSVGGASGDMILGALVGLGIGVEYIESELRKLIPEHFHLRVSEKTSFGTSGVYLTVDIHEHFHGHRDDEHGHDCIHGGEHSHNHEDMKICDSLHMHSVGHEHACHHEHNHNHGRSYSMIRDLISGSNLNETAKEYALAAFLALASAESEVHQVPIEDVHFHEVGAVDSIVDTVGCALALSLLNVDGISLSPLPVGEGTFKCAHGIYPLPAPATSIILRNYSLPVSFDVEKCEMLTPTAASLFAIWKKIEIPPGARVVATANSFGSREMKFRPNLLRATLYEYEQSDFGYKTERLLELETNIDDSTGERLSFVASKLFENGALDVWFEPIQMKKGRPASRLCVLVTEDNQKKILDLIFKYSGVFGVRMTSKTRYSLDRKWEEIETQWGKVRIKIGMKTDGRELVFSPEYEDVAFLANGNGVTFEQVYREALTLFNNSRK